MEQNREPGYKLMHILCQLIYDSSQDYTKGKGQCFFQLFVLEKLDSCMKRLKLDHCLIPHTKINSKWIKDLNIKLVEEYIGGKLLDIDFSDDFFNHTKNTT